jgi:hypothetical protein
LGSSAFRGSRRSQEFLRYVVSEKLAGRADQIKERTIAMAVFGRDGNYEPSEDSIVRVKAAEVRKRLVQFYKENPSSEVVIDLKPGSYVPAFRLRSAVSVGRSWRIPAAAGLVALASVAAVLIATRAREPAPLVQALWKPILEGRSPVLIGVPSPSVFQLQGASARAARRDRSKGLVVPPDDIVHREIYWVGIGAAHGAARFASYLAAHGKSHVLKTHGEISIDDLRNQPALLLGGVTSPWGRELTKNLRFQMITAEGSRIVDTREPSLAWRASLNAEAGPGLDYALITRVSEPSTKQVFLEAAGLTPHGTRAAAEFVTNEDSFSRYANVAPPGWQHRNIQVVIRCTVLGTSPGPPEVVAFEVW